jgi:F-type H+-transporting ATPase subunit delta
MQNPRLATRYAKSIFDLAAEQNKLDDTLQDMQLLSRICTVSREFENMLRSPIIKADKKQHIIEAVCKDKLHLLTLAFIKLMVNKGREANMPEIAEAFITQYNVAKKIKTLRLSTAITIDKKMQDAIRNKVAEDMKEHLIELETEVNPDLIGGFVLEMEDKLFDASVRRDLHDIRRELIDSSYISNLR